MYQMEILEPVLEMVLTIIAGLLGTFLAKVIKKAGDWIEAKIGAQNYEQARQVAHGIYVYLEDKYRDSATKMGEAKKAEMTALLLRRFPTLSEVELEAINKEIWSAFNAEIKKTETVENSPVQGDTETKSEESTETSAPEETVEEPAKKSKKNSKSSSAKGKSTSSSSKSKKKNTRIDG